MSGWHTPLQDASFKDVFFEIERTEESDGKALAEHARPFVKGTELEDMGGTGRQVQIAAVFWGKGYAGRLKKLLDALAEPGAGVLVHPVWGRMRNIIAASWSYRHEADNVDYAAVDITFREAAEAQEIFVFENSFLVSLEKLTAQTDLYREAAFGFIDAVLAADAGVSDLWGSTLGIWTAAAGTFAAVRTLFDFDKISFPDRGGYSAAGFRADAAKLFEDADGMMRPGIRAAAGIGMQIPPPEAGGLSAWQRFDAAFAAAEKACAVPAALLQGRVADGVQSRLNRITPKQVEPVSRALRLIAAAALAETAAELIEAHGEEMAAPDVMHVNRTMRRCIQAEIAALREIQAAAAAHGRDNGVYGAAYQTAESLRETAGRLNMLAVAAINRKPPLIVRPAPLNGTMHQIAHAFYGNFNRAGELVRLNPHINHPAFVRRGTPVNSYAA